MTVTTVAEPIPDNTQKLILEAVKVILSIVSGLIIALISKKMDKKKE